VPTDALPGEPLVPSGAHEATLLDLFDLVVDHHGDRDAIVECIGLDADGSPLTRRVTFRQLAAAADALAGEFITDGVSPGDVVAIALPSGIDYAISHHAALRVGAIATGINPRLGPTERDHILAATTPARLINEPLGDVDSLAARGDPMRRRVTPTATDPVCIVWTGGTTGVPKGVVFDHQCQSTMAAAAGPLSAVGDRRLSPLPFAHVGTMTRLWDEWSHLITTIVTPTPWTPEATAALLLGEGVTVSQGVPTQYALLCDHLDAAGIGASRLGSLRIAGIGGARIPPDLVLRIEATLGAPVVARYASTESCVATGTTPGDPVEVVCTTVGRPTGPVEMRVVDDRGTPLPPGAEHVGRVCVRSRATMRGYVPAVAADPTSAPPSPVDPDGWLDTGDLGWVGDDGNLRLVGRTTEMYIRGGYNVYPAEVENTLASLDGVAAVAVLGAAAPGSRLGEVGVAFVVPTDATTPPDADVVRNHVATHLAGYKIPDIVVVVDQLPLTALGKVDKRALQPSADDHAAAPHRPTAPLADTRRVP
jgi:acyl-CoA synthetase (AMP-forming)/AMP-acid ligase II